MDEFARRSRPASSSKMSGSRPTSWTGQVTLVGLPPGSAAGARVLQIIWCTTNRPPTVWRPSCPPSCNPQHVVVELERGRKVGGIALRRAGAPPAFQHVDLPVVERHVVLEVLDTDVLLDVPGRHRSRAITDSGAADDLLAHDPQSTRPVRCAQSTTPTGCCYSLSGGPPAPGVRLVQAGVRRQGVRNGYQHLGSVHCTTPRGER